MKYSFYAGVIIDPMDPSKTKKIAYISLEEQDNYGEYFLDEIRNLKLEYLSEITSKLQKLLAHEITHYDFGFEVYNFDCTEDECNVLNTFEAWKVECVIPTTEVYQLLRDWRDYLVIFEKTES